MMESGRQWRIQDFPEEGAPIPKGGHQPIIWLIFSENCMKMKKFWARGGHMFLVPPFRSSTGRGPGVWLYSPPGWYLYNVAKMGSGRGPGVRWYSPPGRYLYNVPRMGSGRGPRVGDTHFQVDICTMLQWWGVGVALEFDDTHLQVDICTMFQWWGVGVVLGSVQKAERPLAAHPPSKRLFPLPLWNNSTPIVCFLFKV